MRIFIAVELPEEIRKTLFSLVPTKFPFDGVNVVAQENLHITLKFLGEVESSLIEKIKEALSLIAKKHSSFTLNISYPGVFPDTSRPRVIWIGTENSKEIKALARDIEKEMEAMGFPSEKRDFKSHITLARVKNFQNGRLLFERINKNFREKHLSSKNINLQFSVKDFVLMKSTLTPRGSIYEVLEKFPLC